jgi:uncharacterized ParB-like nuclease family protein
VVKKDVKNIFYMFLGCFRIEEIREKDNETGMKEEE